MPDAHRKIKKQIQDFANQPSVFNAEWILQGLTTKRMKTEDSECISAERGHYGPWTWSP